MSQTLLPCFAVVFVSWHFSPSIMVNKQVTSHCQFQISKFVIPWSNEGYLLHKGPLEILHDNHSMIKSHCDLRFGHDSSPVILAYSNSELKTFVRTKIEASDLLSKSCNAIRAKVKNFYVNYVNWVI